MAIWFQKSLECTTRYDSIYIKKNKLYEFYRFEIRGHVYPLILDPAV